ncbi:acyl-CoA dehydratase activase [Candidatus Latescibacterota bacterium]
MVVGIGIDIGSVSIKAAVIVKKEDSSILRKLTEKKDFFYFEAVHEGSEYSSALSEYRRIKGQPLTAVENLLDTITEFFDGYELHLSFTGTGGKLAGNHYSVSMINEFAAIVEAVNHFHPEVRTVLEMGGETSKFILLEQDKSSGRLNIADYGTNGDCAAGTGAFIDQQTSRLKFKIEDVGGIVGNAQKTAQIAGRCSVFAKSDMIHAQQRGYQPDEVLKGLCSAVTRNFKSVISRSKKVVPPVIFIGGVSMNSGVYQSLSSVFDLDDSDITVPETMCWLGALGCAVRSLDSDSVEDMLRKKSKRSEQFPSYDKLSLDNVTLLRESSTPFSFPESPEPVPAYLGVDIGSVSTNLVVIDSEGRVIKEIYTQTKARPIEVVSEGLKQIYQDIGKRIDIKGVATTGSGRELIGILIGADTINDEITAHKTGSLHVSRTMLGKEVDTIFEIGGQDSKFISIEDGIVVDFTMNDACAAGTGSFLEEQAEDLNISIINEFAKIALSAEHPIRLGERCTVFMGRDLNSFLQRGAPKEDLIAGLAYSVVYNYLNRVVRDRKIGDTIFFQGGTAYNDSVAAAFARVTEKEIIVPPHNGVIGAIGVALLAKRKMEALNLKTSFKGFDLTKVNFDLREFTCKGCSNFCTVQEFTVDGEKTYWGDKCSERYRKRKKVLKSPVIEDLYKIRENYLKKTYVENGVPGPTIGIPMSMYTYDRLPFFNVYLTECGFCTILSDSTKTAISNAGIENVVAEPCYPITVAHGHFKELFDRGVDYIWIPNIVNSETETPEYESYVCAWGMTLPFIAEHAPAFHPNRDKILKPTIHFRDGEKIVKKQLFECMEKLGVSQKTSDRAAENAFAAQEEFVRLMKKTGEEAIKKVKISGEKAIVLVGRPYNIYDRAINLSVAAKLSSIYGINVIPMDFFTIDGIDISKFNENMFWNYGKKILQTAIKISDENQFDIIYITNFKCGPDSFIKQFMRDALGRPFLVLQFDGHSNDAGMMTRCEAYLDSKGYLSTWEVSGEKK